MNKPTISVIAATRRRVALLQHMLQTLWDTAAQPKEQIEVVLRCDFDDEASIQFAREHETMCIIGPRRKGYATLATLVNEAARLSHADLVIVVNDDVEFVTPGWDIKLVNLAAQYPDGIFDFGVRTDLNDGNFVFPCTSRRVINTIGIHHPQLIYSDIWLRDIMATFGRAIPVLDVTIRHKWVGITEDQQHAIVHHRESPEFYQQCVQDGIETIQTLWSTSVSR